MKIEVFERCFKELCFAFDLEYENKKKSLPAYYDSKLGELTEIALLEIIKKAKTELQPKQGYLPTIRDLVNLYFDLNINRTRPEKLEDRENFYNAVCPICDETGFVSLWKDKYLYGGFCCTCIKGQNKQLNTELGRKMGLYTDALKRGFMMEDDNETIDTEKLENFKRKIEKMKTKIALDMVPF